MLEETHEYNTFSEALEHYLGARDVLMNRRETGAEWKDAPSYMKMAAEQMDRLTNEAWTELNRSE